MRPTILPAMALAIAATAAAQQPETPDVYGSPAEQSIAQACLAIQNDPEAGPSILQDAVAEQILKAMPVVPGQAAATGIAVGINDWDCACSDPAQIAELATRLGFSVGKQIGDVEGSAALICDAVNGELRLVTVPPRLNQIESCIDNTGLSTLTDEVFQHLQHPTGNGLALSTVKLGDRCICDSDEQLDFLTQRLDEIFNQDPDAIFGFARFNADLSAAACIPRMVVENTDERIVDPASPNQPTN